MTLKSTAMTGPVGSNCLTAYKIKSKLFPSAKILFRCTSLACQDAPGHSGFRIDEGSETLIQMEYLRT